MRWILVLGGAAVGLVILDALVSSAVRDAGDMVGEFGWWAVPILLAWPVGLSWLAWRDQR